MRKSRNERCAKTASGAGAAQRRALCEVLERRVVLAAAPLASSLPAVQDILAHPMFLAAHPVRGGQPFDFPAPPSTATTPAQMRHFYGVDNVNFQGITGDGRGQTIAIVDVYHDPNAVSDLHHFDSFYNLSDPPSFKQYNQSGQLLPDSGGTGSSPGGGPSGNGWQIEESLDIEWAHVIAPAASIALVETNSSSFSDLNAGVTAGAGLPNVVAVSMSWGSSGEFAGETAYDSTYTASGITYLGATGDNGKSQTSYPAASPNVVAVGGTSIQFAAGTTDGTFGNEVAWSGTGGELSPYELKPSYQNSVLGGTKRGTPDVSMDADPNTGVAIYDSYDFGSTNPWAQYGGTSLSTPMWAALVAILDQGRASVGLTPLSGLTHTLPTLYGLPQTDYHDITSGSNGRRNNAGPGYDTVTGIGTPVANKLLNGAAGVAASTASRLAFTQPPSTTAAGSAVDGPTGVKVAVQDGYGNTITGDTSTVTLTLNGGTFASGGNTASVAAVNGVATFSNLVIDAAGSYTLTAADGTFPSVASSPFSITPAAASKVVFGQQPTDVATGNAISPSVTVDVEDQFGNIVTAASTVTLTLSTGTFHTGSTTAAASTSGGVATFNALFIDNAGSYTLTAADDSLAPANSAAFSVTLADVITGTSGSDNITLTQNSDGQHIDWTLGSTAGRIAITDPNGLTINGNGGNDTITLINVPGNPLPNVLHIEGTFTIDGLSGSNPLAGTTLEIGHSTVYISYADPASDPLAAIQSYLRTGYNNGAWNGVPTGSTSSPQAASTGVITSIAAAQNSLQTTAIGYADAADGLIAGQPANTIELKYTLYGDTSLAGTVGPNDFTRLAQNYHQPTGGAWDTGDFNYDGAVDFNDFTLLTRTYNTTTTTPTAPAPTAQPSSITTSTTASPSSALPAQPQSPAHRRATPKLARKHM